MATNAKYKLYDGSNWVEYHFTTNAGQVSTTYNSETGAGRKFVTPSITINSNTAGTNGAKVTVGSGDAANIEIDGAHITGQAAAVSGYSLEYISDSDSVAVALGKLDKAAKDAADAVPSYVVTYDSNGDVDIGSGDLSATILTATGSVATPAISLGTAGSIHTDNTVDLVIETDNSGDIILSPDTGKSVKWDSKVLATLDDIPTVGTAAAKDYTTSVTQNSNDLVTSGAVWSAIDNLPEPMVFKGTVGTSGTIEWSALPSAASSNEGFAYKVITAHSTTPICEVGDVIVSNGSEWVVIPSGDDVEDTWRAIKISGSDFMGNGITTGYLNFASDNNISLTGSNGNTITVGVATGYSIPSTSDQTAWSAKYDKPSGGIPDSDLASSYVKYTSTNEVNNQNLKLYGNEIGLTSTYPATGTDSYVKMKFGSHSDGTALKFDCKNVQISGANTGTIEFYEPYGNNFHVPYIEKIVSSNAASFSSSSVHAVGDYMQYKGTFYKCNTAYTGNYSSNTDKWTAVTVFGEIATKANVTVSNSAPSSPSAGMIWFDTSNN